MKMNKFAVITVSALAFVSLGLGSALAANSTDSAFINADGNKDNVVSMSEAMGAYPTLNAVVFAQADADGDGSLDDGEFYQLQGLSAVFGGATSSSKNS